MEEEVSLEFDLLVDQIEKVIAKDPASPLSGISRPTLSMVISYSKIHFHPSTAGTDFDLQYFKQLDIDHLFNLIQVFHFLPTLPNLVLFIYACLYTFSGLFEICCCSSRVSSCSSKNMNNSDDDYIIKITTDNEKLNMVHLLSPRCFRITFFFKKI